MKKSLTMCISDHNPRRKSLENNKHTLFAKIEKEQYEAIRFIKFKERKSLAEITREALADYIKKKSEEYPSSDKDMSII